MSPEALNSLAQKIGLPVSTCAALLRAGWRYIEEANKPARWVSPVSSIKRQT